jgi:hypothetical protein
MTGRKSILMRKTGRKNKLPSKNVGMLGRDDKRR